MFCYVKFVQLKFRRIKMPLATCSSTNLYLPKYRYATSPKHYNYMNTCAQIPLRYKPKALYMTTAREQCAMKQ